MSMYKSKPRNEFEEVMEKKKDNIAEAQKRKNDAIQIAGLQRDATLLTVAEVTKYDFGPASGKQIQQEMEAAWERWHSFLQAKLDKQILGF